MNDTNDPGDDTERRQRQGALPRPLRELGYFVGAAVGIAGAAMLASFALGLVAWAFGAIGAAPLGALLVSIGKWIAGAGVGFLGTFAVAESRSRGAKAGCWVGVVIYYVWLIWSVF